LVPDEDRPGDGAHTGYLNPTSTNLRRFRDCDPALYDALGEIVRDGDRNVRIIHERPILPPGTVFYEEPLSFDGMQGIGPRAIRARLECRARWVQGAIEVTRECDVVFADPDNGLESGTSRHRKRGPKFAYFDELAPYLQRGQSLVVYHHLHRGAPADTQVQERLAQIGERLGAVFALLYRRGTLRVFFVVPSEPHRGILAERSERFVQDPCWSQHFTLIEPEDSDPEG
jgi:hypothetical protein